MNTNKRPVQTHSQAQQAHSNYIEALYKKVLLQRDTALQDLMAADVKLEEMQATIDMLLTQIEEG